MKYAKQINFPITIPDTRKAHVVLGEHGKTATYAKARVIRKYFPKKHVDSVRMSLPEKLRPFLISVNFAEIRLLAPHVHIKEQCVINHYVATNGEITKFYEGDIVKDDSYVFDNGNDFYNVDITKVYEIENFAAKDGDTWVLCSRQPHSVSYLDDRQGLRKYDPLNDAYRSVIQLYMDAPFNYVSSFFDGV
jgi:hypothetical protein